ncbi:MAG: sugar transferase [Bryobacterales bacterium]|nr:sugar transferase [Bryobacterales bacterium]
MIRLFSVFIPTSILGLVTTEVALVFACYTAAIAWQLADAFGIYMQFENGTIRVAIVTATIVLGLYLNDCYVRVRVSSRLIFVQQLCLVIGVAFLLQATLSYGDIELRMPRQSMLMGSALCLALMSPWRTIYNKLSLRLLGAEKILFLGTHPLQRTIAQHLKEHPEFAMLPLGFLVETEQTGKELTEGPVLGLVEDALEIAKRIKPDRIVVGLDSQFAAQGIPHIINLQQENLRVEEFNETFQVIFGRVPIAHMQPSQIVFRQSLVPSMLMLRVQTVYSWLISFVAMVILCPVMLATALAVRLTSPGPVLFRQTRTGKNNIPFVLYKFRSMYIDAEARTGAVWAQENDPRVTPLGRALRKYRLDELPQLFNVLRGEMAMVGPRPERPEFIQMLAKEIPFYMQRLAVKPGITGWAQVNYRYGNTIEDTVIKLEYDLYYIKNFSPQLDFYVMFHTVKTMLLTRGAY